LKVGFIWDFPHFQMPITLSKLFSMNIVLKPILKLLSRPVVCTNFQGLETNTLFSASVFNQGYSTQVLEYGGLYSMYGQNLPLLDLLDEVLNLVHVHVHVQLYLVWTQLWYTSEPPRWPRARYCGLDRIR
jgi:hypothetical protein